MKKSISKIAKRLNLSRQTVRKALKSQEQPVYQRNVQPTPKLGSFKQQLVSWLEFDAKLPRRQRRTAQVCMNVYRPKAIKAPMSRTAVCTRLEATSPETASRGDSILPCLPPIHRLDHLSKSRPIEF